MKPNTTFIVRCLWGLGVVALIVAMALWCLRTERDQSVERESQYLARVARSLLLYQADHDGEYPPDVSVLARASGLNNEDSLEFQRACVYLAGKWDNARVPGEAIVAYCVRRFEPEYAHVLLSNGNLIAIPEKLTHDIKPDGNTVFLLVDKGGNNYEIRPSVLDKERMGRNGK